MAVKRCCCKALCPLLCKAVFPIVAANTQTRNYNAIEMPLLMYTKLPGCILCVCVWGVKDQREFGMSVRKEKVKRVRGVCRRQ